MTEKSLRAEVLDEAKDLVLGDRNNQYGPPTQDFKRTSDALTALGYGKRNEQGKFIGLDPHDIAIIQILVKTSRLMWTPNKKDSWVDLAGYASCGYECVIHHDGRDQDE